MKRHHLFFGNVCVAVSIVTGLLCFWVARGGPADSTQPVREPAPSGVLIPVRETPRQTHDGNQDPQPKVQAREEANPDGATVRVSSQRPTVVLQLGHSGIVFSAAFSADGKRVVTGSGDYTARLWDVASGAELRAFEGHSEVVTSVAFSPDGKQVLTGSRDRTARLWDAATSEQIRRFQGHTGWISSVAFSSDGKQVLTGSKDKTARLWDAATGREIRTFQGHASSVTSVAFSPDGKQVLTGSWDNTARLWNAAQREACPNL